MCSDAGAQRDRGGKCVVEGLRQTFEAADFRAYNPPRDCEINPAGILPDIGAVRRPRLRDGNDIAHRGPANGPVRRIDSEIPFPIAHSVRKNVLLSPASEIKQHAMRQKLEAGPRQLLTTFANQHSIEPSS